MLDFERDDGESLKLRSRESESCLQRLARSWQRRSALGSFWEVSRKSIVRRKSSSVAQAASIELSCDVRLMSMVVAFLAIGYRGVSGL